jgi:uncharacterized protein (TIGR02285 family)
MRFRAVLTAALTLLSGVARAADEDARPHLVWVMAVPPPIHIADRTGYADETLDWFIARLPQFRHEVITTNSKRLQDMLASGDGVCGAAMLATPERERTTAFSKPIYWSLPNRLIVSAERPAALDAHLNDRDEVDLPALLADRSFVGGLQFGRSYGRGIDEALAAEQNRPDGGAALASVHGPGHFDMLAGGRFDWTLGFPIEASWWARRLEGSPEKTHFLADLGGKNLAYLTRPIAGSTGLVPAYFGCSRRPLGLTVIAAIDRLVQSAGPNPPWLAYYLNWLDAPTRAEYLTAREAVR